MKEVKFNKNVPCIPLFFNKNTSTATEVKEMVDDILESGFDGVIIINYLRDDDQTLKNTEIVLNYHSFTHNTHIKTITKILEDKPSKTILTKRTFSDTDGGYISDSDFNYYCYLLNEEYKSYKNFEN